MHFLPELSFNETHTPMQTFLDTFVCAANQNGTGYFFFEFFDEPWKVRYPFFFGPVNLLTGNSLSTYAGSSVWWCGGENAAQLNLKYISLTA